MKILMLLPIPSPTLNLEKDDNMLIMQRHEFGASMHVEVRKIKDMVCQVHNEVLQFFNLVIF
jgi:hypothetical protein